MFALVGIPWLVLIVVAFAGQHRTLQSYTRGATITGRTSASHYRIVMQGYWLEGGSKNFYFQPFYRWVSGLLHLVFGDSSIGEFFWEGGCYLSVALLAFSSHEGGNLVSGGACWRR